MSKHFDFPTKKPVHNITQQTGFFN